MDRLLKKHRTAATLVPPAILTRATQPTKLGAIYYGSTSAPMTEADEILIEEQGVTLDLLRVRAFPFGAEVETFIAEHDMVFVVEQNRDAQMRSLLINELEIDPKKLVRVLHYDGTPITARFIAGAIGEKIESDKIVPLRKVVS
jgi:2-oxoglutarate ferredoxin oxidoreductase subunit alpha